MPNTFCAMTQILADKLAPQELTHPPKMAQDRATRSFGYRAVCSPTFLVLFFFAMTNKMVSLAPRERQKLQMAHCHASSFAADFQSQKPAECRKRAVCAIYSKRTDTQTHAAGSERNGLPSFTITTKGFLIFFYI